MAATPTQAGPPTPPPSAVARQICDFLRDHLRTCDLDKACARDVYKVLSSRLALEKGRDYHRAWVKQLVNGLLLEQGLDSESNYTAWQRQRALTTHGEGEDGPSLKRARVPDKGRGPAPLTGMVQYHLDSEVRSMRSGPGTPGEHPRSEHTHCPT